MTRDKRACAVLTVCGLLILGIGACGQATERATERGVDETVTISGTVGLPRVTIQGLPGECVTDENGVYAARVPTGWAGVVRPVKEGYVFEPSSRTYVSIARDESNEHYVGKIVTVIISGNVGISGAALEGLPRRPLSDPGGHYSVQVPYGWSGTVTPVKEGHVFDPPERVYHRATQDQPSQDYVAKVLTFTISGNAGVEGVRMRGLPGGLITDADGNYSAIVAYGWTGTVVPEKTGYELDPPRVRYLPVTKNRTGNDFNARVKMLTISDVIVVGGVPIVGVAVTAEPGGFTATTDSQGRYVLKVPYGWCGRLVASKPGFDFASTPSHDNVMTHLIDGKRVSSSQQPDIPAPRGPSVQRRITVAGAAGEVVMIPTAPVDPTMLTEVKEDMGVMLQILREKLSEPRTILGVLYDFGEFFGSEGRQVEALYLQGYGALFVMEVSFPLSSAKDPGSADGNEPGQPVDPVWQRARQRLYAPPGAAYRTRKATAQTDPESFEQFKQDMVKTLKHAANIRHLESDESVVLTIVGQNEEPAGAYGRMRGRGPYGGGGPYGGSVAGGGYSSGGGFSSSGGATSTYSDSRSYSTTSGRTRSSRGGGRWPDTAGAASTVLTIQAIKADIDAFAQGDLDFEQFSDMVKTFSY